MHRLSYSTMRISTRQLMVRCCVNSNAGQTCVCTSQISLQSGIHDRFVDAFVERQIDEGGDGKTEDQDWAVD